MALFEKDFNGLHRHIVASRIWMSMHSLWAKRQLRLHSQRKYYMKWVKLTICVIWDDSYKFCSKSEIEVCFQLGMRVIFTAFVTDKYVCSFRFFIDTNPYTNTNTQPPPIRHCSLDLRMRFIKAIELYYTHPCPTSRLGHALISNFSKGINLMCNISFQIKIHHFCFCFKFHQFNLIQLNLN